MISKRPVPEPNVVTRPYWELLDRGILAYQRCLHCLRVRSSPRAICTDCQSNALEMKESAGHGILPSYTVVHRAPTPAFKSDVPYGIALVQMNEGFPVMALVDKDHLKTLIIGDTVQLSPRDRGDGVKLLYSTASIDHRM